MKEERLMILKLLQEGKINEEEAERLLDALEGDSKSNHHKTAGDSKEERYGRVHIHTEDFSDYVDSFGERMDEFGEKMEDFGEKFGTKMSLLGSQLAEKSMGFAEKVIDFVENNIDFDSIDSFSNFKRYEEIFEKTMPEVSSLSLKAINGKVTIKGWLQDKLLIKAYIRAQPHKYDDIQPIMNFVTKDDTLSVYPKVTEKLMVSLEVFLPSKLYQSIAAETKNSSVAIDGIECTNLLIHTKNAPIILEDMRIGEASCSTGNAAIIIKSTEIKHLLGVTKNGKITIEDVKAEKIEMITTNAKINTCNLDYSSLKLLHLKTTNGKITIGDELPNHIGLHLEAGTSHGSIKVMPSLILTEDVNSRSSVKIIGKTPNYDGCHQQLSLKAFNSNGDICIFQ